MDDARRIIPLDAIAKYMSIDADLWVVPRFERLHLINILAIQKRLSKLEQSCDIAIANEWRNNQTAPCSEPYTEAEDVLQELQATIKAYDDAILAFAAIRDSKEPQNHVFTALWNEGNSGNIEELHHMLGSRQGQKGDFDRDGLSHLLSIANKSRSWFHRCVERHDHLGRLFQRRDKKKEGGKYLRRFPEKRLRNVELAVVAASLCLVQLLPVLALTLVTSRNAKLGIIIALIVLVSLLNAAFANTVQATNFGAVAAYSAIIVAFVSQTK